MRLILSFFFPGSLLPLLTSWLPMAQALPLAATVTPTPASSYNNNNNNNNMPEELQGKLDTLATCGGVTGFCSSGRCLCSGFCEGVCMGFGRSKVDMVRTLLIFIVNQPRGIMLCE
ncbi:uncharacterized protein B0T15DRAFT_508375 [Chaetomium strumarium]|uniref:Uncharacterized protein n=1 Tax=Chaetomium strumarium TaxID=1170767 RepID=A0AAJ0M3P5_9PEZI|nr:hypothetical protein B0T15DRAFT_508375 [Chaetomium strumarium]